MTDPKESLIRDLVAWIADAPRPYPEVMEGWRTACPRLTVWEDAVDRGLLACEMKGGTLWVVATAAGRAAVSPATPP
ncbi:hypothetical protein [Falsiroseomonas sp.]|uniref:hypothetical protein n=1 Tax=Falsiroseomonas sp. TaxID=2870721 RepID=UPI002721996E|nr:hypothetical protein [Falsiroseomonas sp.]MDO9502074.1 hypothetical protein [Falsiroseomonas sp.]